MAAALLGSLLLIWNPSKVMNVVAVALIGFAIAPIFPALMSGTSQRVKARFASNTIGMQIASGGVGTALVPSLLGVLARRFSLEIIPVCILILFFALFTLYRLSMRKAKKTVEERVL